MVGEMGQSGNQQNWRHYVLHHRTACPLTFELVFDFGKREPTRGFDGVASLNPGKHYTVKIPHGFTKHPDMGLKVTTPPPHTSFPTQVNGVIAAIYHHSANPCL